MIVIISASNKIYRDDIYRHRARSRNNISVMSKCKPIELSLVALIREKKKRKKEERSKDDTSRVDCLSTCSSSIKSAYRLKMAENQRRSMPLDEAA